MCSPSGANSGLGEYILVQDLLGVVLAKLLDQLCTIVLHNCGLSLGV